MLSRTISNQLLSKLMAISLSLLATILPPLPAFALDEKSDIEVAGSTADSAAQAEMEKQLALPLDNLEDIGYTLQRVQQQAIDLYEKLAHKHQLTLVELALAFVQQQPFVTSTIIGATTMEQLKENIATKNVVLSPEILKEIDEIQAIIPDPSS